jgi:hypothetical protein
MTILHHSSAGRGLVKNIVLAALAVLVAAAAGYYAVTRYMISDEARVRGIVEDLIAAMETDSMIFTVPRVQVKLADDYRHEDPYLRSADRSLAARATGALVNRYNDFQFDIRDMTVTVEGDRATVDIIARVTAVPANSTSGRRVEVMTRPGLNRAIFEFERRGTEWLIVSSRRVKHELEKAQEPGFGVE